jgi:putative tryptophan/tyrosine transport system substrate-binding protein
MRESCMYGSERGARGNSRPYRTRREFIMLVGGAAAWPLAAHAQQPERMRRIGVLMGFAESDPAAQSWLAAFRDALTKLGWKEAGNLQIEVRWAAADPDRIRTWAKELVDLRPEAIFAQTTPVMSTLARETPTIPVVFAYVADPIGFGFATSFAHPGGNITGFTFVDSTMGSKWLELLKEIAPGTGRAALLFNPATAPQFKFFMPSIQEAALSHAVETIAAPVHAQDEIEGVIAAQARNPGGALIVMPDVFTDTNRQLIIALTARYGVPAIYPRPVFAQAGGLIAYGVDLMEQFRQAAGYIDRILKGEKPGDLPIQQPTKFQLVINLKTAKALGLVVPLTLQASADEVIE